MENKIIQIVPAPIGSWVLERYRSENTKRDRLYPAAYLALFEYEEDDELCRSVYPVGFDDNDYISVNSCLISYTLHQSEQDAKEYLKQI